MASKGKKKEVTQKLALPKDSRLGWHFLPRNRKLKYSDGRKVTLGKPIKMIGKEKPRTCNNGMHASEKAVDAARYADYATDMYVLCRVIVSGDLSTDSNKFCGRERTVIWWHDLSLQDLKEIYTGAGSPGGTWWNESDYLSGLRNLPDGTIEKWAAKKGWNDVANKAAIGNTVQLAAPVYQKPEFNAKVLLSLLNDRVVRTKHEIMSQIKGGYEMTATDSLYDDRFDELLDDYDVSSSIHVIESFTKSGADGYLRINRR